MGYSHGTDINSETRVCTKCHQEFPNTTQYFTCVNRKNGRLNAVCKSCQSEINKVKRLAKIEANKNKDLFYEGTRKCKKCGRELPNNKLYFSIDLACVDGLRNVCRECSDKEKGFLDPDYTTRKKWTDEEGEILRQYYQSFTGEELHDLFLPNRTVRSIECHGALLGLQGKNYETQERANESRKSKCYIASKGKIMSDESRKRLSETKKEYFKTHDGWWKGKK